MFNQNVGTFKTLYIFLYNFNQSNGFFFLDKISDIEPQYSFNPISKYYEVCFNHSNGVCVLSILEHSKWVNIKKIYIEKKKLHLLNYMIFLNV